MNKRAIKEKIVRAMEESSDQRGRDANCDGGVDDDGDRYDVAFWMVVMS